MTGRGAFGKPIKQWKLKPPSTAAEPCHKRCGVREPSSIGFFMQKDREDHTRRGALTSRGQPGWGRRTTTATSLQSHSTGSQTARLPPVAANPPRKIPAAPKAARRFRNVPLLNRVHTVIEYLTPEFDWSHPGSANRTMHWRRPASRNCVSNASGASSLQMQGLGIGNKQLEDLPADVWEPGSSQGTLLPGTPSSKYIPTTLTLPPIPILTLTHVCTPISHGLGVSAHRARTRTIEPLSQRANEATRGKTMKTTSIVHRTNTIGVCPSEDLELPFNL